MENKSIVLVVSPLIALMQDQVARIKLKGISAACITDKSAKKEIKRGAYQVLFAPPEALGILEWRNMLTSMIYCENIVGFIIEEAHCIKKWLVQGNGIELFVRFVSVWMNVSGLNFLI